MKRAGSLVFLVLAAGLCACGGSPSGDDASTTPDLAAPPIHTPVTDAMRAYCGTGADQVEARIDALLPQLTLEEKATLMHGDFEAADGTWTIPGLDRLGIPALHAIDGPRGVGQNVKGCTAFPVGEARAASFDPDLERRVGEAIGAEAHAGGADVILAPTMNVLYHPRWGRAQETYGEDTFLVGTMAAAFIEGAQQHVLACAKHFDVYSIEDTRLKVDVSLDERTLREVYLPQFRRAVEEAHVATVMTAYNSVDGAFCSQNPHLVHDVLKGEWGFAGPVMSDWFWGTHDTVAAATAGLDLEMPTAGVYGDRLVAAVQDGQVPEADLDEAVRRLLRARFCRDVESDPPTHEPAKRETPDHLELAREAAERSIVLLQNTGGALPIDRAVAKHLVVTGKLAAVENIGDIGSSNVAPSQVVTALQGIAADAGGVDVQYLAAPPATPDEQALVAGADAVIVVAGLSSADEGEQGVAAGDRKSLALSEDQVDWIHALTALSSHVVLVLEGSGPLTVGDLLPEVQAVLFAWYPGEEGGDAIARVLFGEVDPSGRLPMAFPEKESDLPPFDDTSLEVHYGYLHGYRWLDANGTAPLFPFGYGLSYTSFRLANLKLDETTLGPGDTLHATVDVTNTGSAEGVETVQLYVGAQGSQVMRPVRELRAFAQADLMPGETKTVTLDAPVADWAYWDTASSAFVVEPTSYLVEAGTDERDLPLSATVTVTR